MTIKHPTPILGQAKHRGTLSDIYTNIHKHLKKKKKHLNRWTQTVAS